MKAIYELSEKHLHQLCALYQNEWWTKGRTFEETVQGVKGSQICVGLVDDSEDLQGFVRVLTDFTFKALILDVIVSEPFRECGLGRTLVGLIQGHSALAQVKHFELYCLPELVPFYERYGFSTDVGGIKLMRKVKP